MLDIIFNIIFVCVVFVNVVFIDIANICMRAKFFFYCMCPCVCACACLHPFAYFITLNQVLRRCVACVMNFVPSPPKTNIFFFVSYRYVEPKASEDEWRREIWQREGKEGRARGKWKRRERRKENRERRERMGERGGGGERWRVKESG